MSAPDPQASGGGPTHTADGKFAPGNTAGRDTRFGGPRSNPRHVGAPRVGVGFLRELRAELDREGVRQSLAARLLDIALKGEDADSLRALREIEDRIGGPVALRVEGLSEADIIERLAGLLVLLRDRLPAKYHATLSEVAIEALGEDIDDDDTPRGVLTDSTD